MNKHFFRSVISAAMVISMILSLFTLPTAVSAATIPDWNINFQMNCQGTVEVDNTEFYNGNGALRIVNKSPNASGVCIFISQNVNLIAGREYKFHIAAKADRAFTFRAKFDWDMSWDLVAYSKTFDWTEFDGTYIPETTKASTFSIWVQGTMKEGWIDDVQFIDTTTGENLIKNGHFDTMISSEETVVEENQFANTEEIFEKIMTSDSFSYEELMSVSGGFEFVPVFKAKDIKVDGEFADWADYPEMKMPVKDDQTFKIKKEAVIDNEMYCRYTFDEQNLYALIRVKDDIHFINDTYWVGDSLQFCLSSFEDSYGWEFGFNYNDETGICGKFGSGMDEGMLNLIQVEGNRIGDNTYYEIMIPWSVKFNSLPEKFLFCFLSNENDGDGRESCIQLSGGISTGKTNSAFPVFQPLNVNTDWYAWIASEKEGFTGIENEINYFLVNRGEERKFIIENHVTGEKETVTVPAETCIRRNMKPVFDEKGKKELSITFKTDSESYTAKSEMDIELHVDKESTAEIIQELYDKADELEELMDKCHEKGLTTDYENLHMEILRKFANVLEQDLGYEFFDNVVYTYDECIGFYEESKSNLEAYLSGEKIPLDVPSFVSDDIRYDGQTAYATVEMGNGACVERPYHFVGYGHFDGARKDIPFFGRIDQNIIQISATMNIITYGGWSRHGFGKPDADYKIDYSEKLSGEKSMKFEGKGTATPNNYVDLYQTIQLEGGKTYEFKAWAKSTNANGKGMSIALEDFGNRLSLPSGAYDWTEFSKEIIIPEGNTATTIRIFIESENTIYMDNLSLCEKGRTENLIGDGSFEDFDANGGDWKLDYNNAETKRVIEALEWGEENDVQIVFLISPHLPAAALTAIPGVYVSVHNIPMYLHHPAVKKAIKAQIEGIYEIAADYSSFHSICLSNETEYHVTSVAQKYSEWWWSFLEERYGDIEALNAAYGENYTAFNEVELSEDKNRTVWAKNWDVKQFNDTVCADFHRILTEIAHEIDPTIPVHAKIVGYTNDIGTRGYKKVGSSYEKYYEFFDLNGCDYWAYYSDDVAPFAKAQWYDFMTSVKNVPVINTEDHIIPDGYTYFGPELADYCGMDIWQGGLHGRAFSTIWWWERPTGGGSNIGDKDYSLTAGSRPDVVEEVAKATYDLNRNAYEVKAIQDEPADIGMLYCDPSHVYDERQVGVSLGQGIYAASIYNGKKVQYIIDDQIEKIHNYKLVFVPDAKFVKESVLLELKKYIENGGRVVVLGEHSMEKNEKTLDNNPALVNFIRQNSTVIPIEYEGGKMIAPTTEEFYSRVRDILNGAGLYYVSVIDLETGAPAVGVEYNLGVYDGDVIINLVNYTEAKYGDSEGSEYDRFVKRVKIYIGDKELTEATELRSGDKVSGEIVLNPLKPILLKVEGVNTFFDTYGHWAENNIIRLADMGIISGMSESRFAPNGSITRAEFLALLVRASEIKEEEYTGTISDVAADKWYANTVAAAYNVGIIRADAPFRPEEAITREEMCEMLIKCYSLSRSLPESVPQLAFGDNDEITLQTVVAQAVELKLMYGYEDGKFAPKATSTRAEAVAVVARFLQ